MKNRRQQGFTLIELTVVMSLSMLIAFTLTGMLQTHLQMMSKVSKYQFVAKDAPFIGLLLTKTVGNAEDYRIYATRAAVASNSTPILTGQAVRLWMRQPNSTFRQALLSYETINGHKGLYFLPENPSGSGSFPSAAWELAGGQLTNTAFDASTGILLVTLTGTYGDTYTFAAEKK
jgi:prepilin-type N-terminal cleavage/methylation domain-containing protein